MVRETFREKVVLLRRSAGVLSLEATRVHKLRVELGTVSGNS